MADSSSDLNPLGVLAEEFVERYRKGQGDHDSPAASGVRGAGPRVRREVPVPAGGDSPRPHKGGRWNRSRQQLLIRNRRTDPAMGKGTE